MSNSNNILYLLSLMLLMLTGCEADTSIAPFPNEGEEPVEVRFHATVVGASAIVTRGENYEVKKNFKDDDRIGIWNPIYNNLSLTYNSETNPNLNTTDNSKIYYPYATDQMTIYAYAPYSATAFDAKTSTVKVRSEWETNTGNDYLTDPLWAKATISKEEIANFRFKHQMARLKIYLVNNTEAKEYAFHQIQLTFDRPQYGEMSLQTGQITAAKPTPGEEGEGVEYTYTENMEENHIVVPKGQTPTPLYDHTILPGSILKKIQVIFKTSTEDWIYSKDFTEINPFPDFEAGKTHQLVIDFGIIEKTSNTTD